MKKYITETYRSYTTDSTIVVPYTTTDNTTDIWDFTINYNDPMLALESKVKCLYREVYHGVLSSIQEIQEYEESVSRMTQDELRMALEILETILEGRKQSPDKELVFIDVSFKTDESVDVICNRLGILYEFI